MKPPFSEFSYGFALSYEICLRYQYFQAAPELPSLSAEGHSGYDISFPLMALFLQFKRSDYLTRSNAKQMTEMGGPYYRAELWERWRSDQHELLVDLANQGNTVLYACSSFHRQVDLDRYFRDQTIEANSGFFRPSDIGLLADDEPHCIAFEAHENFGLFFSEPRRIVRHRLPAALRERVTKSLLAEDLVRLLTNTYRRIATPGISVFPEASLSRFERTPLAHAGLLSRLLFNCELLVARAA